ncbi:MAG TPA: HAD hydrolase-like protein [Candidatus Nanoarchaeia archaeon]|nr:HAD hydrolase-like protein [Candidatus Nanoarchaeia archaeon]
MIKLIIFDLDNTLFDTYSQLGVNVLNEMIYRMRKAGLKKEYEPVIRAKYPFTGFRILARELKLSPKLQKIGLSAYEDMDLSGITPYPDIEVLKELGQKKALVTSGIEKVQMNKVRILGIQHFFEEVVVDEDVSVDGRKKIFSELAQQYKAKPKEVMVIGDNPFVELAAGKSLGMVTVHILRRQNVLKGAADYHVKDLYEVKKILEEMRK